MKVHKSMELTTFIDRKGGTRFGVEQYCELTHYLVPNHGGSNERTSLSQPELYPLIKIVC